MNGLIRFLGSLSIAVPLLIAIAAVLAWGTIYETRFGTAAVQRFIYTSWWFQAILGFLAVNLAVSALQRWPWKRQHTPFLCAHLGIILILVGGIIGGRLGIEGQLIIPEGQAERRLQLPQNALIVSQPNPGGTYVIPTHFESTAWVHEPHALFQVPLEGRNIQLVVDHYYPNAVVDEEVAAGGEAENPAIRLSLRHGEEEESIWLLAKDPERFGLRWGEPDQKLIRTIAVPESFGEPVAIEGTPYQVSFKEYFSDFTLTEQGPSNRSSEPNNPAVALVLSGPEGSDVHLLFALHPDFAAMHGRQHAIHARVTYTHPAAAAVPPSSVVFLRGPDGKLAAVMSGASGQNKPLESVEAKTPYTHPWLNYEVTVAEYHPKARLIQNVRNRDDEVKMEFLHVIAQEGNATAQAWLGFRQTADLELNAHPIRVEYRPVERELPVTIKLLDFRKIDYPGTTMAAGFESDVELTDPQRGLILMRKISMNNPLRYRGFSFYQSSFIPGTPETTVLAVRSDPGTPLVYAGFLIVIGGVVSLFWLRPNGLRGKEKVA
ncbi:MAG: cytochrome c biogenesis protein ResB [Candidatus Omnitrophica bacterium]|nr:cytochrome c biogenesis protein ResB [Candidatus Omnitrophota bacterium]